MIRVAAVSDIHSPKYLELYEERLRGLPPCDIFLFAGDLILKGDAPQLHKVVELTRMVYKGEILACFGNEEYDDVKDELVRVEGIRWLDDEKIEVEVKGLKIAIIGSRGALDRPTFWQQKNIPDIRELYLKRVNLIDELLVKAKADLKVVLTHYPPTYRVLEGERPSSWPEMACKRFEPIIERRQPDCWIHGHVHRGKVVETSIGRTLIRNVSFPANGKITVLELPRKTGLEKFLTE